MKTKSYITSLPSSLLEDLEKLSLTKGYHNSAIHLLSIIKNKSYKEYGIYDMPVPLPFEYLSKVFTNNYKKNFLNKLIKSNIIISNEYYSKEKSICLNYRINNKYKFINNKITNYTSMCLSTENSVDNSEFKYYQDSFKEDIKTLKIDVVGLRNLAVKKIESLSINDFHTNEQIEEGFISELIDRSSSSVKKYKITFEHALMKAKTSGLTLIQDKTNFYLQDADEFIVNKKAAMIDSYLLSIKKLDIDYLFANRNTTNYRLDTNITNMCGDLVDKICDDNDLVQIDLSNSQFAILSNLMKLDVKVNANLDFLYFKGLCEEGQLYTHLQKELGLESRKTAKRLMFHLAFSNRTNSKHYSKLKVLFPTVTKWISDYKKSNGSNAFAIMLQQQEAKMFIDNIWHDIKEQGFFCLTKHDSIIVRRSELKATQEIVNNYFASIDFKATVNVDSKPIEIENLQVKVLEILIENELLSYADTIIEDDSMVSTIINLYDSGNKKQLIDLIQNKYKWQEKIIELGM